MIPPADRIPALKACLASLAEKAQALRKQKRNTRAGAVMDNFIMLTDVIEYGVHGGKVSWPVNEDTRECFKKHGVEDFIHDAVDVDARRRRDRERVPLMALPREMRRPNLKKEKK